MTDFTHSSAVVIGIDTYGPGIVRLTTMVNDAARFAEMFTENCAWSFPPPATSTALSCARTRAIASSP